jgi:hypothetical protein
MQEFGITAGGFTNFPANKNYLKENISVFYIAPYLRIGRHEFTAGLALDITCFLIRMQGLVCILLWTM